MSAVTMMAAALSLLSPTPAPPAPDAAGAPTVAELRQLIEGQWPDFARRIRQQNRLHATPLRLTSLPQALCNEEFRDTYECVSLVRYQLSSRTEGRSLLRHHVRRDSEGRLLDAILVRETPAPR